MRQSFNILANTVKFYLALPKKVKKTKLLLRNHKIIGVPLIARVYFKHHGQALPVTRDARDYQPGDLVTWVIPGNLPHIGIVVTQRSSDAKRPMVVHNIGRGPQM